MAIRRIILFGLGFALVYILFVVLFMLGSGIVAGKIPVIESEPGLVSDVAGLLIFALVETSVIAALVLSSRWGGWKLALLISLAYYGAVTVLTQIETWYFLSDLTVSAELLPALFLMRIPVTFILIPVAVWVFGKGKAQSSSEPNPALVMPGSQWVWKLAFIALAYLVLYWSAGYFIAWQNPELRAFYGSPGEPMPFLANTINTLKNDPGLFPFQILRSMLWTLCALPVIRGSRLKPWGTALLVGAMFSLPQNVAHIIANPLIPIASVRLSHMIETASSTFIFGVIVVWMLHRQHQSIADVFGLKTERLTGKPLPL